MSKKKRIVELTKEQKTSSKKINSNKNSNNNKVPQVRLQQVDTPACDAHAPFCAYEWLELTPKGIVFEGHHFVMLLEDKSQKNQLPLRFPLDSGDMLSVPNIKSLWKKSLTEINEKFFPLMGIQLQRCVFVPGASDGGHRVRIFFKNQGSDSFFESDLDRVLGLCLDVKLPFYATSEYIQQSKVSSNENSEIFLKNQRWTDGRQKYLM